MIVILIVLAVIAQLNAAESESEDKLRQAPIVPPELEVPFADYLLQNQEASRRYGDLSRSKRDVENRMRDLQETVDMMYRPSGCMTKADGFGFCLRYHPTCFEEFETASLVIEMRFNGKVDAMKEELKSSGCDGDQRVLLEEKLREAQKLAEKAHSTYEELVAIKGEGWRVCQAKCAFEQDIVARLKGVS